MLYASLSQSSGNRRFVGLAHSHQAPKLLLVLVEAKEFEVTEPLFKLRSLPGLPQSSPHVTQPIFETGNLCSTRAVEFSSHTNLRATPPIEN